VTAEVQGFTVAYIEGQLTTGVSASPHPEHVMSGLNRKFS
jgi:hypothetical protein